MSESNVGDAVLLADFVAALGCGSRAELELACPFPVLVDVTAAQEADGADRAGETTEVALLRRLDAALQAPEVTLHLLEPRTTEPGEERFVVAALQGLQFVGRGASWSVEDPLGGLMVEARRRPPGSRVPLACGQRLDVAGRRLLFLTPSALHLLVGIAGAEARVVLPAGGMHLKDLHAVSRASRPREACWPPLLIQVPTDDEAPSAPGTAALTEELSRSAVLGLQRDVADDGLVHSVQARGDSSSVTVGRAADCDTVLADGSVSKRHAQLVQRQGAWHVVDLGSQNGTFVRGEQVPPGVLTPLDDGDPLWFGKHRCVFLAPAGVQRLLAFFDKRT